MRDRLVQHPNRYIDQVSGKTLILTPAFGTVTQEGSMYSKAMVLPDEVCHYLGFTDAAVVEPKDAFMVLGSGRYYGKMGRIESSQQVGNGEVDLAQIAFCTKKTSDDYNNIPTNPDGKFSKVYVTPGAKKVNVTMSSKGAKATFGDSEAQLRYHNGTTEVTIGSQTGGGTSFITETTTYPVDVLGTGNEFFYVYLIGSGREGRPSDERGFRSLNYLQVEVVK